MQAEEKLPKLFFNHTLKDNMKLTILIISLVQQIQCSESGYAKCRVFTTDWESENEQEFVGYSYKDTLKKMDYLEYNKPQNDYTCQFENIDGSAVTRDLLMNTKVPLLITGVADKWKAIEEWKLENLQKHYASEVFTANLTHTNTINQLLENDNLYHIGLLQRYGECYSDGKSCIDNKHSCFSPNFYGRLYSPFIANMAKHINIPDYLTPSKTFQIGLGKGAGIGVIPEEHPRSWWANIVGTKRWVIHPETMNSPHQLFKNRRQNNCDVPDRHENTMYCDQKPGTILWIPDGWWHETCHTEDFSIGIGAISNEHADHPKSNPNVCEIRNKEHHGDQNANDKNGNRDTVAASEIMFNHNEDFTEYTIDSLPYCQKHNCITLSELNVANA